MAWLEDYSKRAQIDITDAGGGSVDDHTLKSKIEAYYNCPKVFADGSFEWFSSPVHRYVGSYDRTYIGFYNAPALKTQIAYFDQTSSTKTLSPAYDVWSGWGNGNDHSCPTVLALKYQAGSGSAHNGKILISDTEHNGAMAVRRSAATEDVSSWGTLTVVASSDCSYARVAEVSDGRIFLFYRRNLSTTHRPHYFRVSSDAGTTWGDEVLLCDLGDTAFTYAMFDTSSGNGEIHALFNAAVYSEPFSGHFRYRDLYHAYYDAASRGWYKSDRSSELTLPMNTSSLGHIPTLVHATDSGHVYELLWDIKVIGGSPYIMSCIATGDESGMDETSGHAYRYSCSSGSWSGEEVCDVGQVGTFGATTEDGYMTGAVLDGDNANDVYACVPNSASNAQLQKWTNSGGAWGKTEDITQSSPGDAYRPMFVKNGAGLFKVLWSYTESYTNWTNGNWAASLFAYPGYNNGQYLKLAKGARYDFGDLRFTNSDGETTYGLSGKPYIESMTSGWAATLTLGIIDVPGSLGATRAYCYFGKSTSINSNGDAEEWAQYGKNADEYLFGAVASAWTNNEDANFVTMTRFQYTDIGSSALDIAKINTIFIRSNVNSGNVKVALYTDTSETLGYLLTGQSSAQAISSGWNGIAVPEATVTRSSYYWLAAVTDVLGGLRYNATSNAAYLTHYLADLVTFSSYTWPNTFTSPSSGSRRQRSYYATGDCAILNISSPLPSINVKQMSVSAIITSPTIESVYDNEGTSTISISGSTSSDATISSVTWSNNRGGSGEATGTTSWSVDSIPLYSGENVITVTATDENGESGIDTLTVTYTPETNTKIVQIGNYYYKLRMM